MANSPMALRQEPLENERFANKSVTLEAASAASRISLRATTKGAKAFEKSLGFALPKKPGTSAAKNGKHALWLGPDEWLVIDENRPDESMVPRLPNPEFSAVEISHRNAAVNISGQGALATLAAGSPRDLSLKAFPVGACSRTVFGKAEVVLYRTAEDTFRMEFWRSYAEYVWGYLVDASQDTHI